MGGGGTTQDPTEVLGEKWPPLHKDFYLSHPEPSLQCQEFCWGNLEEAHPILGARLEDEVVAYRQAHGISVETVRGRKAPKPFQEFSETSFPDFVEELAYELFTEEAQPFPVQAQVWPCALAGSDVVAVAPTGSGKTLAFLLPALVHIMAQEPLQRGDGPIALALAPTRELAQQTLSIAARFFQRTTGEDTLRVGAVYGGVDPSLQMPAEDVPDFGRWPELLIATPGRLLELLVRRRCLSPRRISYVVFDEADELLSARSWLPQIKAALAMLRPDRQLLMLSATWPEEAEAVARELSGSELIRVRVDPAVPPIPQTIQLFHSEHERSFAERRAALITWLRTELAADEAVLVLCSSRGTATDLAQDEDIAHAVGARQDDLESPVAVLDGANEDRRSAYWRFIRGEVRVLVSSFALGSRGLDYADTAAGVGAPGSPAPLSLAVLLYDFPPTIKDYAHCIGRTQRPGHRSGRAIAFVPQMRFWIARELASLLEHCGQPVPEGLDSLIFEDKRFLEDCREAMLRMREGLAPCPEGNIGSEESRAAFGDGDFNSKRGVWRLPADLPSYRRKLLHWLADELGLPHVSYGDPPDGRRLHIALSREALPDKFFIEGEEVIVGAAPHGNRYSRGGGGGRGGDFRMLTPARPAGEGRAVVTDPRVHRRSRTVRVRFHGYDEEVDVPVDTAQPCNAGA